MPSKRNRKSKRGAAAGGSGGGAKRRGKTSQSAARRKRKELEEFINREEPRGPAYTAREDVIDYLSEDEVMQDQKFVCVSFCEIGDEQLEEFIDFIDERVDGVTREQISAVIAMYREKERPKRAVKVRGSRGRYADIVRRAEDLRSVDDNFHVFIGEVGKWLAFNPDASQIEDENFMESELNELVKHYKLNKRKTKLFYDQQKRMKMELAIAEGTPEFQALKAEQEEPIEAVEHRVKSIQDTLDEFQGKIRALEHMKKVTEDQLVYMKEQVKKGHKYPEMPKCAAIDEHEVSQPSEIMDKYKEMVEGEAQDILRAEVDREEEDDFAAVRLQAREIEKTRNVPEDLNVALGQLNKTKPGLVDQLADAMQSDTKVDKSETTHADESTNKVFNDNTVMPYEARKEIQDEARKEIQDEARKEIQGEARKEIQGEARKEIQGEQN